jgi:hypothetical protein
MTEELVKELIIKEVKNRGELNEGRNAGMGFAMLKKVSKDNYETVQPISPCKDYLNEVIFTENSGIGTRGCGLKYGNKLDIFEATKAYMVITIQKSKSGEGDRNNYHGNSTYEIDFKALENNYTFIEKFVNYFEEALEFNTRTKMSKAIDNFYLVVLPIEWTNSTHAISLYSFLLRVALYYNDTKVNPLDYLKNLPNTNIDYYLKNSILPILEKVLANKELLKQGDTHLDEAKASLSKGMSYTNWSPHHLGIMTLKTN